MGLFCFGVGRTIRNFIWVLIATPALIKLFRIERYKSGLIFTFLLTTNTYTDTKVIRFLYKIHINIVSCMNEWRPHG